MAITIAYETKKTLLVVVRKISGKHAMIPKNFFLRKKLWRLELLRRREEEEKLSF
jgi:hypothetical protein